MSDPNDAAEFCRALANSRPIELNLCHLAAQQNYHIHKDSVMAENIRISNPPGGDVTPQWMLSRARDHAQALYKERVRMGTAATASRPVVPGATSGSESAERGRGRGRGGGGRGRAKGKARGKAQI